MSNVENFENLKKRIDELKVKNLTNLKEKERLEGELCKIKEKIKEVYGVEIEDFNSAIETLEKEKEIKMKKLQELLNESEEKLGV